MFCPGWNKEILLPFAALNFCGVKKGLGSHIFGVSSLIAWLVSPFLFDYTVSEPVAAWQGGQGGHGPPADFFEGGPKFTRGAKKFMKFDGSITFFQHHVASYTGIPYRCI